MTEIELGQIGATLELPVSLHSDKFVAAGVKLVSTSTTLLISLTISAPVFPSILILAEGVVPGFFWA